MSANTVRCIESRGSPEEDYVINDIQAKTLALAIKQRENVLLIGEPGTGKTHLILWLARKFKKSLVQIQGDGDCSVHDLVGGFQYRQDVGTYFQDGTLTRALREGAWVLIDEINLIPADILARLYSVLDHRRQLDLRETNEILPVKDSTFFATMNPTSGRHAGTKPLAPALLDRFERVLRIDYLSGQHEAHLISRRTGLNNSDCLHMVRIASAVRVAFREGNLEETITTRHLLSWASGATELGMQRSFETSILNRFDFTTREAILNVAKTLGFQWVRGQSE